MFIFNVTMLSSSVFSMAALESSGIKNFLPFIMIFFVFYFVLIRPQIKKQKDHERTISNLQKGDKVVAVGGIIGTIAKIDTDFTTIEIAPEVKIKIIKSAINNVLDKDK